MDELNLGERLRGLRKSKKMSIAQLSRKADVSTGLISQIERGKVVPSVIGMYRIAKAMGVDINYFFEEENTQDYGVIRKGEHRSILAGNGTTNYLMLSPDMADRTIDMTLITLKGNEVYEKTDLVQHEGEECGYVLSGIMTVIIEGREYTLYPGDSIYFKSTLPHRYANFHAETCTSIWGMTPKFF